MFLYRSWAVRRYSPAVTPHPIHNNDIIPTCFNKLIFPSLVENAEVPNNFRLSRENKFLHEEGNCIHLQTNKRLILDAPLIRFVIKGPTQKHPFHIRLENVWGLMVSPCCVVSVWAWLRIIRDILGGVVTVTERSFYFITTMSLNGYVPDDRFCKGNR